MSQQLQLDRNSPDLEEEASFVRYLGAHERLLHLYSLEHPRHFCVVAELSGVILPSAFRAAFAQVQARHPMLNVSVGQGDQGAPAFFRIKKPLAIKFIPFWQQADWLPIVERELSTALDAAGGPLMRATVLFNRDRSSVILTFHHAISDGFSGAFIIRDLMQALAGRNLPPLGVQPPFEALLADRSTAGENGGNYTGNFVGRNAAELRALATKPLWRAFAGDQPTVSTIAFGRASTTRLLHSAKLNGTTLHGAICAALTLAVKPIHQKDNFTITSAINRRALAGVEDGDCGMFAGVGTVQFPLDTAKDFWTLARFATDALRPARSLANALASAAIFDNSLPADADAALASGLFASMEYDAIASNLGSLPIPSEAGDVRLDAFWGPMVQGRFSNERVIGAASVDGQLRIVQTSPKHIPNSLDQMKTILVEASVASPVG